MNRSIFLTIPIEPIRATAQSAGRVIRTKDGRMFVAKFQKGSLRRFEGSILAEISRQMKQDHPGFSTPEKEIPVIAWVGFFFSPLKSSGKAKKPIPKTTRPDLDNMAKSLIDCLTKSGLLADDSQIVSLSLSKFHHPERGYIAVHLIYCRPSSP